MPRNNDLLMLQELSYPGIMTSTSLWLQSLQLKITLKFIINLCSLHVKFQRWFHFLQDTESKNVHKTYSPYRQGENIYWCVGQENVSPSVLVSCVIESPNLAYCPLTMDWKLVSFPISLAMVWWSILLFIQAMWYDNELYSARNNIPVASAETNTEYCTRRNIHG